MTWDGRAVHWRGLPSHQLPADLVRLQEEIVARRPWSIVEVGAGEGGTTLFLADLCHAMDHGHVTAVEQSGHAPPARARITWHTGESLERADKLRLGRPVMVILDSDVYSEQRCRAELEAYAPLVTPGQLLVACHVDRADWGMKPALDAFIEHSSEFECLPNDRHTLHAWLLRK